MEYVQPIRDKKALETMKKILKANNLRDYCLFVLEINSGLRISDLLILKVSDVYATGKIKDRIVIREKKTNKLKDFPVPIWTYKHYAVDAHDGTVVALKYGDVEKQPVTPRQILLPRRPDDGKGDLWTKFNIVQENLMRGGQRGRASSGKRVTTRPVQSIDKNVQLNKALWILADEMARLKA